MLKRFVLNKRVIPIPVPLRNLDEALTWLAKTLLKHEEEITKIVFDGQDLLAAGKGLKDFHRYLLNEQTKLEIQADSPLDLSLQSLEAVRNLALVIERGLKVLSVECWQTPPSRRLKEVESVHADLLLIRDLCQNAIDLVAKHLDTSILAYLIERLMKIRDALVDASMKPDWQLYARILLNKLEVSLPEVAAQAESVQTQIYARISEQNMRIARPSEFRSSAKEA